MQSEPTSDQSLSGEARRCSPWQPMRIECHGVELQFYLPHRADHIQRMMCRTGELYESGVLHDVFARTLHPGLIIDVGAHIGTHTVFFAKVLRRHVLALEPFDTAFEVLKENVALNELDDLVTLLPNAAGCVSSRGELVAPSPENLGRARIRPADNGPITIVTLDELAMDQPVALLKVDVEGMELDVLRGATRIIETSRPVLYIEASTAAEYAAIRHWLHRYGYETLRRFNHTPTYAFAHCDTLEDGIRAVLEKTEALNGVEDMMIALREFAARQIHESSNQKLRAQHVDSELSQLKQLIQEQEQVLQDVLTQLRDPQDARPVSKALDELKEHLECAIADSFAGVEDRIREWIKDSSQTVGRGSSSDLEPPSFRAQALPLQVGKTTVFVPFGSPQSATGTPATSRHICELESPRFSDNASHGNQLPDLSVDFPIDTSEEDDPGMTVSVIMTTYNSSRYVSTAIASILNQTHQDLELIIVDDASGDDTFQVLEAAAKEDSRVRPIKGLQNRGTYFCKNLGMTLASGTYITFQDSDDYSDPRRLELQIQELQKQTCAVMCTCNYVRISEDGELVLNRGRSERKAIMAPLFRRKAAIQCVGYFDSVRTSADDEFVRRLSLVLGHHRIAHIDAPLYKAVLREGSLTTSGRTRSDVRKGQGKAADLSFLSAPRREYVRQYSDWHEAIGNGADPVLPFPLLRRAFPAPTLLLPNSDERDNYVTVSLASMPEREELLHKTVTSILPQVDILNVYLNAYSCTPGFLQHEKIRVVHSSEYGDLKDNGKFFFLDSLLWGYHFTIDDDIIYPPNYIQRLVLKIEQYDRQAIVGIHGVILADPLERFIKGREVLHFARFAARDRFVNLLGTGTIAYHVSTLNLSPEDFRDAGMADLWLAIAAKRQLVPMIAIERPEGWLTPLMEADRTSLYAAAVRDDQVQTDIAMREGPWTLDTLGPSFPLVAEFLSEFTAEELASRSVDSRVGVWCARREDTTTMRQSALTSTIGGGIQSVQSGRLD